MIVSWGRSGWWIHGDGSRRYATLRQCVPKGADVGPSWLDRYIETWCRHPHASENEELFAELCSFMTLDIRYEDVPSGAVFLGHAGIRQMCAGALQMSKDMTFEAVKRVDGGMSYAFETVCNGTNTGEIGPLPATGLPFRIRGVSVGELADDGRVTSHRDYWDLAGLLGQLGATA
jgi:hypothetical protein